MPLLAAPLSALLGAGSRAAAHAGQLFLLTVAIVRVLLSGQVRMKHVLDQAHEAGVRSLPLVCLTAVLSGVVTSQQGGYQFTGSIPLYILGSVVASSVILELGPVMTAFVVIGRVGARITAELGTMKVSEQIDALHSLGRDPVAFLAAPRLLAGIVTVPAWWPWPTWWASWRACWPPRPRSGWGASRSSTARVSSGTAGTCSTRWSRARPSAS